MLWNFFVEYYLPAITMIVFTILIGGVFYSIYKAIKEGE